MTSADGISRPFAVGLLARCGVLALGLLGYHGLLRFWIRDGGLALGVISAETAPLYAYWRPHLKPWLIVPVVVIVAVLRWLRRSELAAQWNDWQAALGFAVAFLAIATTLPMLDGGPKVLVGPFAHRSDVECIGGVARVGDLAEFLRTYPEQMATLPMHAQTHPPGAILFLWSADRVLGGGVWGAVVAVLGASALTPVIVFFWARRLAGPVAARRAAALFVVTPGVLLFTATSMDGPFMTAIVAMMAAFWAALTGSSPSRDGAIAGVLGTIAVFLTYSAAIGAMFCGFATLGLLLRRPERRKAAMTACLSAILVGLLSHLILWGTTGYDPFAVLAAAAGHHYQIMAGTRHETTWRHINLTVAQLVAFGITAGLPTTLLAVEGLGRGFRKGRRSTVGPTSDLLVFTAAGAATISAAAALPIYTMEVERIWIFLTPLLVLPVAAGPVFEENTQRTITVAWLLAAQAIVVEILFTTYW